MIDILGKLVRRKEAYRDFKQWDRNTKALGQKPDAKYMVQTMRSGGSEVSLMTLDGRQVPDWFLSSTFELVRANLTLKDYLDDI